MTRPEISFEFFPPKSLEASFRLWDTVNALAPLGPRFVSITYGAGGTTRSITRDAVAVLNKSTDLNVAAHLTCVGASRSETLEVAREFAKAGVTDLVALRGDPPAGATEFEAHADGFANSVELIEALVAEGDFNIRVGAYPEVHPDAASEQANIDWLKRKIDAGAKEAITQFFFEPESFLRFRDTCVKAGIDAPITPGILPIEDWNGVQRFAKRCGTTVPDWLVQAFEKAERDDRTDLLATALCTELCSELVDEGVNKLHFYTLNKPELTRDVCHALGLAPEVRFANVA